MHRQTSCFNVLLKTFESRYHRTLFITSGKLYGSCSKVHGSCNALERTYFTKHNSTDLSLGYCQLTRAYGTRSNIFSSAHAANQFVRWLLPIERTALLNALRDIDSENGALDIEDSLPTAKQLKMVAISNAIPFIGFGLLDNAIMIMAGEYIDHTIGITLGISTMAAAAVGNLISDLMGLGLAGYVEAVAIKLGFDMPPMSTRQASMWRTKYTAYLGRGIGIAIGCILGMFPLLLIKDEKPKEPSETTKQLQEAENRNS